AALLPVPAPGRESGVALEQHDAVATRERGVATRAGGLVAMPDPLVGGRQLLPALDPERPCLEETPEPLRPVVDPTTGDIQLGRALPEIRLGLHERRGRDRIEVGLGLGEPAEALEDPPAECPRAWVVGREGHDRRRVL